MFFLRLFFILLLMAQPVLSYAGTVEHLTVDEIVVTDEALSGSSASEVGVKTIEKGRNITIPDVLKNEPDIDIKHRAAVGDTADVLSIRGLSANRIMLNINGRPVNAAGVVGGYYIDWGTIPLDNIEKIEVIRGGSSAVYGNNALGGVINVITKKPTDKPSFTFYGNDGSGDDIDSIQNYRLSHSYKIGPVGYSLAASYQKASAFLWNNDFEGKNLSANVTVDMPLDGELALGFQYANSERGFIRQNRVSTDPDDPDFYTKLNPDYPLALGETFSPYSGKAFDPGPGAYWDKTKYYLDLGYKQPVGDAVVELKIYKNHEDRKEKNYSSHLIVPSYADGILVLDRKVESDRSYGGSVMVTKPLGSHELTGGVDYKVLAYGDIILNYYDRTYNGKDYTGTPASQEGVAWGYYLQDTWNVTDRFALTAGLRYDRYHNKAIDQSANTAELEDNALTPKLTATYRLTDSDTVTASVYQAMRTPGLPETWWWYNGGLTQGKTKLKPEKNNAGELAWQHNFSPKDSIRLAAYYYSVDDYIIFRFASTPTLRGVYNTDRAVLTGGSIEGRAELTSWLSGRAVVNYQKTKKEGDPFDPDKLSNRIDYIPEWKANAGLDFKLPWESVLSATVRYVGEREAIYTYMVYGTTGSQQRSRLVKLDPYVTADFELKIPVTNYGEASLYVENLFDKRYEEQFGYPLPGRVIGAAVKIAL